MNLQGARHRVPRFARFVLVGTIGFLADAGLLTLSVEMYSADPFYARIVSMLLASIVTWRLNRALTFELSPTGQVSEGLRYGAVVIGAFLINYLAFVSILLTLPALNSFIAVGVASVVSMWASYFGFAFVAFRSTSAVYSGGSTQEPYTGVEELELLANSHNYNSALADLVSNALSPDDHAVDFGAGMGSFSLPIEPKVSKLTCVEPDTHLRGVLTGRGLHAVSSLSDIEAGSVDLVYTLNVLEHIEDDHAALSAINKALTSNGRLVIYVPALQYLYTSMDRQVGHWRRYGKRELIEKVKAAGFDLESIRFADSIGVLATLAYMLADDGSGRINQRALNIYDRWVFPISRWIDHVTGGFYGKNLVLYARKADSIV